MDKKEFNILTKDAQKIRALDSKDFKHGILVGGYELDRSDFTLVNTENGFVLTIGNETTVENERYIDPYLCVPSKRCYPENCDYEFCVALIKSGIYIPFTTFNGDR